MPPSYCPGSLLESDNEISTEDLVAIAMETGSDDGSSVNASEDAVATKQLHAVRRSVEEVAMKSEKAVAVANSTEMKGCKKEGDKCKGHSDCKKNCCYQKYRCPYPHGGKHWGFYCCYHCPMPPSYCPGSLLESDNEISTEDLVAIAMETASKDAVARKQMDNEYSSLSSRKSFQVGEAVSEEVSDTSVGVGEVDLLDVTAEATSCGTMLTLVNKERRKKGKAALCCNDKLTRAAQEQSNWQASTGKMTHTGRGGSSVGSRVTSKGFKWNAVAENVANGPNNPSSIMKMWMNSSGHRANILSGSYKYFGFAQSGRYWTQVFGGGKNERCSR